MKRILFSMIKEWLYNEAYDHIIKPLRLKAKDTNSKWDDELVNDIEGRLREWMN